MKVLILKNKELEDIRYAIMNDILNCRKNDDYKKSLKILLYKTNRKLKTVYCKSIDVKEYLKKLERL